jgi:hypothetical protein
MRNKVAKRLRMLALRQTGWDASTNLERKNVRRVLGRVHSFTNVHNRASYRGIYLSLKRAYRNRVFRLVAPFSTIR